MLTTQLHDGWKTIAAGDVMLVSADLRRAGLEWLSTEVPGDFRFDSLKPVEEQLSLNTFHSGSVLQHYYRANLTLCTGGASSCRS
jgi:hypothetical protein